ncbi:hypothetical protein [Microcoleus sp. F4-D5]|uniref:hypothetical protein n=1 Tax=Microcoleus sp. F4-D5 TaxID=2818760 RepID=UPI002FD5338A
MNTMRTLIQLTTTATLAACLQVNTVGTANAAGVPRNSNSNLTKDRSLRGGTPSTPRVWIVAPTSSLANPQQYEPPPNGSPKSEGTGTR